MSNKTFPAIFGSDPLRTKPFWEDDPKTRGTYHLLISCGMTLFLASRSSIHLDVPAPKVKIWTAKAVWMIMGIVVPELVLLVNWMQNSEAKKLLAIVENRFPKAEKSKDTRPLLERMFSKKNVESPDPEKASITDGPPTHEWTLAHSFLTTMGGLAFSTTDEAGNRFIPGSAEYIRITPEGVHFILEKEPSLLLAISPAQIEDKNKAIGFSKAVLFIQLNFFLLGSISRLIAKFSISLFEIFAMAHVFVTGATAALVAAKPLDVETPLVITDQRGARLAALFYSLHTGELEGLGRTQSQTNSATKNAFVTEKAVANVSNTSLNNSDMRRVQYANEALEKYGLEHLHEMSQTYTNLVSASHLSIMPGRHTLTSLKHFYISQNNNPLTSPTFLIFSVLYGAVLLLSWHSSLPSATHQALWRAGCIFIMLSTPFFLGLFQYVVPKTRSVLKASFVAAAVVFVLPRMFMLFQAVYVIPYHPHQFYRVPTPLLEKLFRMI